MPKEDSVIYDSENEDENLVDSRGDEFLVSSPTLDPLNLAFAPQ